MATNNESAHAVDELADLPQSQQKIEDDLGLKLGSKPISKVEHVTKPIDINGSEDNNGALDVKDSLPPKKVEDEVRKNLKPESKIAHVDEEDDVDEDEDDVEIDDEDEDEDDDEDNDDDDEDDEDEDEESDEDDEEDDEEEDGRKVSLPPLKKRKK